MNMYEVERIRRAITECFVFLLWFHFRLQWQNVFRQTCWSSSLHLQAITAITTRTAQTQLASPRDLMSSNIAYNFLYQAIFNLSGWHCSGMHMNTPLINTDTSFQGYKIYHLYGWIRCWRRTLPLMTVVCAGARNVLKEQTRCSFRKGAAKAHWTKADVIKTQSDPNDNLTYGLFISCFARSTQIGLMYHHNPHNTASELLPRPTAKWSLALACGEHCHTLICTKRVRFVLAWLARGGKKREEEEGKKSPQEATCVPMWNHPESFTVNASLLQMDYVGRGGEWGE